jgi:Lon protease-like protein
VSVRTLPLFPLGTVLFPGGPLALRIFEPRYVDMVSRCLRESTGFAVVLLVEGQEAGGGSLTTAATGTEAQIVDFNRLDDGLLGLTCLGRERLRILRAWRQDDGLNVGEVEDLPADVATDVPPDCAHLPEALRRLYPDLDDIYSCVTPRWDDAVWVGNRLAELAPLEGAVKQGLLELADPLERLRYLAPLIRISAEHIDA